MSVLTAFTRRRGSDSYGCHAADGAGTKTTKNTKGTKMGLLGLPKKSLVFFVVCFVFFVSLVQNPSWVSVLTASPAAWCGQ